MTDKDKSALAEMYAKYYGRMYDGDLRAKSMDCAENTMCKVHDAMLKNNFDYKDFVTELAELRGDFFVSDRECAAIVLTYLDYTHNIKIY